MQVRPSRRASSIVILFISAFLVLGGLSGWAGSRSADEGTVVAAYVVIKGKVRPDPGVSMAASQKKLYDQVETYV